MLPLPGECKYDLQQKKFYGRWLVAVPFIVLHPSLRVIAPTRGSYYICMMRRKGKGKNPGCIPSRWSAEFQQASSYYKGLLPHQHHCWNKCFAKHCQCSGLKYDTILQIGLNKLWCGGGGCYLCITCFLAIVVGRGADKKQGPRDAHTGRVVIGLL